MKRTNLVLDEELLRTATQAMGAKTYSEAVNRALEESVRLIKIRNLVPLFGQDIWQGNLAEIREDKPSPARSNKKSK
jgi:Arc/MetJ family transcription regulator